MNLTNRFYPIISVFSRFFPKNKTQIRRPTITVCMVGKTNYIIKKKKNRNKKKKKKTRRKRKDNGKKKERKRKRKRRVHKLLPRVATPLNLPGVQARRRFFKVSP